MSGSERDIVLPNTPSDREMFQINLLKTLLRSYFEIVRKNVQDITVKVVWCAHSRCCRRRTI